MPAHVDHGTVIFRGWDQSRGLDESYQTFNSIDELFRLCLVVQESQAIDRIVLHGQDEHGISRTVTFKFQSLTVASDR